EFLGAFGRSLVSVTRNRARVPVGPRRSTEIWHSVKGNSISRVRRPGQPRHAHSGHDTSSSKALEILEEPNERRIDAHQLRWSQRRAAERSARHPYNLRHNLSLPHRRLVPIVATVS